MISGSPCSFQPSADAAVADALVVLVDGLAVAILDAVDQRRHDLAAAIGDGGIGRGHAHVGGFAGAQRHGEHRLQRVVDAEHLGVFGDQRHADILGQPHGHDVTAALDAAPQRLRAVEFLRVVLRPPDRAVAVADFDRRIEHHRGRRVAVVERRRIDDRLERRAGLAQRLGGAVELGLGVGEAADHGQHAAGARVHGDQRAFELGHLLEGVGARLAGERRDVDHVAELEESAELLADPLDVRAGQRAVDAIGSHLAIDDRSRAQADTGLVVAHLQHHGELPFRHVAQRLDLVDRRRPSPSAISTLATGPRKPSLWS